MRNKGFSLVELSIVIVILGLLVGGILAGQNLIRGAQLRGVITDFERINVAVNNFLDQYGQLPGDGDELFDYFGTDCAATAAACNGDNNGRFDSIVGNTYGESWMAIRQLALAGFIEGDYTGTYQSVATSGENLIPSSLNNAGFWFWTWPDTRYFQAGCCSGAGTEYNWIHLGGEANDWPQASILKPREAENIDKKMDDGMPGMGRLFGPDNAGCSTSATPEEARYDVARDTIECELGLKL